MLGDKIVKPLPIRELAVTKMVGIGLPAFILLAPSSVCAQDLVLTPPPDFWGECGATTDPSNTGSADATTPCPGGANITFADSVSNGACPVVQIITRTWTATDACGNFANADQLINLLDTESPVLSVPPDVYVTCGQSTDPQQTGNAVADDDCAVPTVTWSDVVSGSCPDTSLMTRSWTAEDSCGNSTSQDQLITISPDTDGDGVPDSIDPDDDDDGIGDALDTEPLIASNECNGGDLINATLISIVENELTCAARETVTVLSGTKVQGSGNLHLIAETVILQSDVEAKKLDVIAEDSCPGCP